MIDFSNISADNKIKICEGLLNIYGGRFPNHYGAHIDVYMYMSTWS